VARLVPIAVVLALMWVALSWPDRLVWALVWFLAGCAFTGSLPWFVRWGQEQARRAKDSEGNGGHGLRKGSGERPTTPRPPFPMATAGDQHCFCTTLVGGEAHAWRQPHLRTPICTGRPASAFERAPRAWRDWLAN
jgi:hypothetical protein